MQKLTAFIIFGGAVAFAFYRIYQSIRRKKKTNCPHCSTGETLHAAGNRKDLAE